MSFKEQYLFVLSMMRNNIGIMIAMLLLTLFAYPVFFYSFYVGSVTEIPDFVTASRGYFIVLQSTSLIIYLVPIIVALSIFSYLFKKNSSDFFHSLAINRSKLLLLNFIAGCLVFVIPFTIGYGMLILRCMPVASQMPVDNFIGLLLVSYVFIVLWMVLIFAIFTFCATYARNIISTFFVFFTVFLAPILCVVSFFCLLDRFLLGFAGNLMILDKLLQIDGTLLWEEVLLTAIGVTAMTVIIYLLANLSYKKRKDESSSKILSTNWLKNMFLISTLFIVTSMTLYFADDFTYIIAIVVSIVTFILAKAIVEHDPWSAFGRKSIVMYVSFLVFMGAIVLVLSSGILGNKRIPEASEVESVTVTNPSGYLNVPMYTDESGMICTDPETTEIVLEMHEDIISQIAFPVGSTEASYSTVVITYYMENGDVREYAYNYEDIPDQSIMSDFVNTEENKENLFYFIEDDYVIEDIFLYSYSNEIELDAALYELAYGEVCAAFLEPEVSYGLVEAIKSDVMNDPELTVQRYDIDVVNGEEAVQEGILCSIEFYGSKKGAPDEYFVEEFLIKDSYTNTIEYIDKVLEGNFGYGLKGY